MVMLVSTGYAWFCEKSIMVGNKHGSYPSEGTYAIQIHFAGRKLG